MASINEPLSYYQDKLRDEHANRVSSFFEELVATSGVDAESNRQTIQDLRTLEAQRMRNKGAKKWWIALRVLLWSVAVIATIAAIAAGGLSLLWLILAAALVFIDLAPVASKVKELSNANLELEQQIGIKLDESWDQMESLNQLFEWDLSKTLMSQTFPDLKIDDHFSEGALQDLVATYGLTKSFKEGRSILRIQSGTLNQNPVVFTRFLQHWIGNRTYYGSLTIYWVENVRNAAGQVQSIQRSQTLTASVVKAFPEFAEGASVILGHEAAPNLSFSRAPSNLSGLEEGRFNSWRKASSLKAVEKEAKRQLKSGSGQLTTMSNREFETLFRAIDRNHEIEFRLLYTPLAQQETVKLLNDRSVAHGDDFYFSKTGKINYVEPAHLAGIDLDPNPSIFHSNDLEESREFFNNFNANFFKSLFFGVAPLLAIPLYSESRTLPKVKDLSGNYLPNSWEVEVMSNEIGEESLRHPKSITRNLLWAEVGKKAAGGVEATVTSLGYKGVDRVDFVAVFGGDGQWHQVAVPWVEYISVERQSTIFVARVSDNLDPTRPGGIESKDWQSVLSSSGAVSESAVLRAQLGAAILR